MIYIGGRSADGYGRCEGSLEVINVERSGEFYLLHSFFFRSNTEQPCVVAVLVLANPIFGFPLELPRNPSPIKAKFLAIAKSSLVYGWTPSVPHFTLSLFEYKTTFTLKEIS